MPNFTYCSLNIDGSKEHLEKFYNENKSDELELDFFKSAPLQNDIEASDIWGTKWNAIDCEAEFQNDGDSGVTLHYQFQTAWDEPYGWFKIVAQKYPELEFCIAFEDEGWMHCGEYEAYNGVVDYNKYEYGDPEFERTYREQNSDEEWEEYVSEREEQSE